jgi:hypothetical protein
MFGAVSLGAYRSEIVRIACDTCGRGGEHDRDHLVARFGTDADMSAILPDLADCRGTGPCGARYPDVGALAIPPI